MKVCLLFFSALLLFTHQLFAQAPPIGTWRLATGTYTDPEGKVHHADHTQVDFIKIITPTHFMFIAKDLKEGGGARSIFGEYRTAGDKYVEILQIGTFSDGDKHRTDYTYKVDGDRFTMKGPLTLPDGRVIGIDEVFERVKTKNAYPENKAVGTWALVSSKTTQPDGRQTVTDNSQMRVTRIVTPTHWMQIVEKMNGSTSTFENSSGGSYTMDGELAYPVREISTVASNLNQNTVLTTKVKGNRITFVGHATLPDGGKVQFEDVFERVKTKPLKVASTR